MTYDTARQQYLIAQFIAENKRSPTQMELTQLLRQNTRQMPTLNRVGFAGYVVEKPQFASLSSVSTENKNREAIYLDTKLAGDRALQAMGKLENLFRGAYASAKTLKHKLDQIESRLDNLLLLSGSDDVFVYGVEEDFVVQDKVDFTSTTASVESGYVTLGRDGFGLVDISDAKIKFTTTADKGYIGTQNTNTIESLKSDDGSFWEYLVYTGYKQGRVSLVLDVVLPENQLISEVRFTGATSGLNSPTTVTGFTSVDNKTFSAIEPAEVPLTTQEGVLQIGQEVKTVRLLISKQNYDTATSVNGQYVYTFALDSIKLYSQTYATDTAGSLLLSGPYEVLDEEGNAVNFTKATASLCLTAGDTSGVGMYLSNDGTNYLPLDPDANATVTFINSSGTGTEDLVDPSVSASSLVVTTAIDLDPNDAVLNTKVDTNNGDKVVRKSIVLKRNIPVVDMDSRTQVYGIDSGWFYDELAHLYSTTVYVSNPEGLALDLGSTSALVNGIQMTGSVKLQQGYSVFQTTESNYHVVPSGLTKLVDLKKSDPLYPYNHKLLIEGYGYSDTFKGERLYQGVDEYFGSLATYVPPELFSVPENAINLGIFTTESSSGLLFKVKADKSDASWSNEAVSVNWSIARGTSNRLWLKLVLTASEDYISPIIKSVSMRVV